MLELEDEHPLMFRVAIRMLARVFIGRLCTTSEELSGSRIWVSVASVLWSGVGLGWSFGVGSTGWSIWMLALDRCCLASWGWVSVGSCWLVCCWEGLEGCGSVCWDWLVGGVFSRCWFALGMGMLACGPMPCVAKPPTIARRGSLRGGSVAGCLPSLAGGDFHPSLPCFLEWEERSWWW